MIKRYILSAVVALMATSWSLAQNDALVVERHNGRADIFAVSANLKIVNQSDNDSIIITEGENILASFARADVKRIAFEEESILTDSVERAALIALYKATDGDNWTNNENWCTDKPLDEWCGVNVEKGFVSTIYLHKNNLNGTIPEEIGNLKKLNVLCLMRNNLSGEFPTCVLNLTYLTTLQLGGNNLTGKIPSSISNLTYLMTLELYNNPMVIDDLSCLKSLKNLRDINLSGTRLSHAALVDACEHTGLTHLEMQRCPIKGNIPKEIGNLTNLIILRLGGSQLTGEIPTEIGNLTNLEQLDLWDNELHGELPESLSNLTKLIQYNNVLETDIFEVSLYNNKFSGKIPSLFYNSPSWDQEWPYIIYGNPMYDIEKDVYIPAPSFHVTDLDGNILDSKEIYPKNKYTAIFHWATWCGFSLSLMKVMIPLYEKYKDYGLDIIGLCEGEEEQTIRDYIAQNGIKWRNFISEGENTLDYYSSFQGRKGIGYPTAGTPELTLIDSEGRVVFTDCVNDRFKITEFLRERLGEGNIVDAYASTDYSRDGYVETLQTATTEKDIKVVIIGDGYSDRQVNDHTYRTAMLKAKDALFATEPMNSYRDRFTVKYVTAVSENEYIGENSHTALSCYFGEGTHVGGDNAKVFEYAKKAISEDEMDDALIIVIMNEPRWAGTCYMYQPEKKSDWGSGATIAYVPNIGYTGMIEYQTFETLLAHEAIGHGFVKLGDEYEEHSEPIPAEEKEKYQSEAQYGWWKNTDFTSDPTKVKWSDFITDDRYKDEGIGVYEGALTYSSGAYRPTQKSIMTSTDTEFNAPSREAIWYRINKLTQGEGWEGTHEDFVAFDQQVMPARVQARRAPNEKAGSRILRGAPPIVKGHTWRMEK
jgi:Leucine-rich repeat (LRR) protein